MFKEIGNIDQNIFEYREAIRVDPTNYGAHYNLGITYAQESKWDDAITEFNNSLKINSKYLPAIIGKCNSLGDQGKYEEALKCFEKALQIDPTNEDAKKGKNLTIDFFNKLEEA